MHLQRLNIQLSLVLDPVTSSGDRCVSVVLGISATLTLAKGVAAILFILVHQQKVKVLLSCLILICQQRVKV